MADKGEGGGRDSNDIVTKLLQLANTPSKKRQIQMDESEDAKNKKAHGSVRAEIFTFKARGTVGVAYRKMVFERRANHIREY